MDDFFKRYKHYETFPIEQLKHIPEISFYNHNYYIANHSCNNSSDLLYVETDEYSEISEFTMWMVHVLFILVLLTLLINI